MERRRVTGSVDQCPGKGPLGFVHVSAIEKDGSESQRKFGRPRRDLDAAHERCFGFGDLPQLIEQGPKFVESTRGRRLPRSCTLQYGHRLSRSTCFAQSDCQIDLDRCTGTQMRRFLQGSNRLASLALREQRHA